MNGARLHDSYTVSNCDSGHHVAIIKELHIAPMLNVSTVEFHAFMRILTKRCILWTEMIVDETIYFQRRRNKTKDTKKRDSDSDSGSDCENRNFNDEVENISNSCDWTVPLHILYPVKNENHPIVCQIGTIQPMWTSIATQCILTANYNVNELNINLDCPSNRVQGKEFGAVLMQDASKVMTFIQAIQQQLPNHMCVSVKCRIGMIIDDDDDDVENTSTRKNNDSDVAAAAATTAIKTDYDWIVQFIKKVSSVCQRFILHARPVILHGINKHHNNNKNSGGGNAISPAQNRCIPPLNYVWVYRLCQEFPDCNFIINGGISDLISASNLCYGVADDDAIPASPSLSDDTYQGHGVPCTTCRQQNHPTVKYGSCIVPPIYPAPNNLRGCMMGRAAMDHPIQFAKVDHFWYNDYSTIIANSKATTRRQVLQQYCQFLDTLYPRRCCDNLDTIITSEVPAPSIESMLPFCCICKDFRQSPFLRSCNEDHIVSTTSIGSTDAVLQPDQQSNTIKIATRIIDRSLKPILNIFHGCNGSKLFRHHCEALRRNIDIRNCGPAYILYHAAIQQNCISDSILDESII